MNPIKTKIFLCTLSIFLVMAYGQSDGEFLLSEFWGTVEYTEESLAQYENYVQNQFAVERERFVSKYDASA